MIADMIAGGVGLAFQAYGAYESYNIGKQISNTQQQMTQVQLQEEVQKRAAMELQARRAQMEVVRNNQRARAMALNTSTGQGAQFGSGLSGAYGQISGASGTNLLGIDQNLSIGRALSDLTMQQDKLQGQLTQEQGQLATAQGIAGMGKGFSGSVGQLGFLSPPQSQS